MCCLSSSTSSSFRDGLIIGTTRTGTGRPPLCVGLFFPSSQFLMSDHAGRRPPLVTSTLADPLMIQHQILQSAGLWPRAQIWPVKALDVRASEDSRPELREGGGRGHRNGHTWSPDDRDTCTNLTLLSEADAIRKDFPIIKTICQPGLFLLSNLNVSTTYIQYMVAQAPGGSCSSSNRGEKWG